MIATGSVVLIYRLREDYQRVTNEKVGDVLGQKVIKT